VAVAARHSGFGDLAAFRRRFRAWAGVPPSALARG
jgi:AraC-like DNA-binding protein